MAARAAARRREGGRGRGVDRWRVAVRCGAVRLASPRGVDLYGLGQSGSLRVLGVVVRRAEPSASGSGASHWGYLSVRAPNLRPGRTCTYCWVGKPHSVQVSSRTNQKYIYHELENIKMEAPCYIHGPNTSTWRKKNLKRQYGVQFNK